MPSHPHSHHHLLVVVLVFLINVIIGALLLPRLWPKSFIALVSIGYVPKHNTAVILTSWAVRVAVIYQFWTLLAILNVVTRIAWYVWNRGSKSAEFFG